jgi:hypothetical protein
MHLIILCLLLVSLAWGEKRVTLGQRADMDVMKLYERLQYIRNANQTYHWRTDSHGNYVFSVRHKLVDPSKVFCLEAVLYGLNAANARVDPPDLLLRNVDGFTELQFSLRGDQFDDAHGCQELNNVNGLVGKVCRYAIDYFATDLNAVVMTLGFSLRVLIPQSGSHSTGPIEVQMIPKENAVRKP